jgi:hypothetical protein
MCHSCVRKLESCERAAIQREHEHGSRRIHIAESRYLANDGEYTESLMFEVVKLSASIREPVIVS